LGALPGTTLHGVATQETASARRPAFYVAEFEVTDREGMKPYNEQVEATFKPFSVRYVVRGGASFSLEGEPLLGRPIMIEFDSVEQAQAWYHSPAYEKLKPIRHRSGKSLVYLMEGIAQ
jgi:uncharacterized protein (DUF1330 family)